MKYKTIILSDIHLGSKSSKTKAVLKFLDENISDILILNGDIIDMWALKRGGKWKENCNKIINKIIKISKKTKVVYLVGNHDDFLHDFQPLKLSNITIVKDFIYISKGKRYYIFHGDVLDVFITKIKWLSYIGSIGYDIALWLNDVYNWYRTKRNLPYYSISRDIKNNVKKAVNFINDFEKEAIKLAKHKNCDIAITGHIHQPVILDGYMNSGDFVENCSVLVEDEHGNWSLIENYS